MTIKNINQLIGFTLEVFSFVFAGYLVGTNKIIQACLVLLFAFGCAIWTGNRIKEDAVEEYKNEL